MTGGLSQMDREAPVSSPPLGSFRLLLLSSLEWKGKDGRRKGEGGNVDQGLCEVPEAGKPGMDRAKVGAAELRGVRWEVPSTPIPWM